MNFKLPALAPIKKAGFGWIWNRSNVLIAAVRGDGMRHSVVKFTERPQFIILMGGIALLLILTGTLLRNATFGGVSAMWLGFF